MRRGLALASTALCLAACRSTSTGPAELPFPCVVEFRGAESVRVERLDEVVRDELARLEVKKLDRAAVDDAAFALELFYRARGYPDVVVEYELIERSGAAPIARFSLAEGPLVRVGELVVEGAAALAPADVRAFLAGEAEGRAFDAERLAADVQQLRDKYLALGHLHVAIEPPLVERSADGASVAVRVTISEGPAFHVRSVVFEGGVPELAELEADLARPYRRDPQHPPLYSPEIEPEIKSVLVEQYARRGYPDAEPAVVPQLDEESGDVTLVVRIVPGPLVHITDFRVSGNERTRTESILDLIAIERGARYDAEERRRAFRDLYATGLFEKVQLELEGEGPERTLAVEVVETRSVEIRIEPGYGSYEGPRILVGIDENNFRGRAQVLSLQGTVSLKARSARLGLLDRDFLGTRYTSDASFFVEQREEPSFEYVRRGFSFFVRRNWTESDWSSSFGYEFRPTNILDESLQGVIPTDITESTDVAMLVAGVALAARDNPLLPTRGTTAVARLEWADNGLGSETEFLRGQLEYTHLFGLGQESVLAAAARTGLIAPIGSTSEIPLPERFFNGGESSVRSFSEDQLGPKDLSGEPIGGESQTTLNLEYRRLLTGNMAAALFVDAGNVAVQVQDYLRFEDFRYGIGLGVRYLLPIGPMRVDFAVNPDPGRDEDDYALHFSVGFPF